MISATFSITPSQLVSSSLATMIEITKAVRCGELLFAHPDTIEEEQQRGGLVWKMIRDVVQPSVFCEPRVIQIVDSSNSGSNERSG